MKHQVEKLFPGFVIGGPVFYSWPIALRFELAGNQPTSEKAIQQATDRATRVFAELFENEDDVIFVAQRFDETEINDKDYLNSCVSDLFSVPRETELIERLYDEDSPIVRRYYFEIKAENIISAKLFRGIASMDFAVEPYVLWDTFIVNMSNKFLFHMYDDRGMDLIATERETLRPIYDKFNSWLLDYDRGAMDQTFNC